MAYGLSFHIGDLPEVSLPSEQPPFEPVEFHREFVTSEELGYDNP